MKAVAILILTILTSGPALCQLRADLTKFVKTETLSAAAIEGIDSMTPLLIQHFLIAANDSNSSTYKSVQAFFDDYRLNPNNTEVFIYPTTIKKEHISVYFLDYHHNYGWISQGVDSAYRSALLTALISIPVFDEFHKGEAVNSINFKIILKVYTESDLRTGFDYLKKENVIELKEIEI